MQMYLGEEGKKYYWRVVDVSNITDVETLENKFDLTEEMSEYVLDSNERARVDYDGKNLFAVIMCLHLHKMTDTMRQGR